MNLNITQSNLHLLLPAKTSAVGRLYAEEHQCSILEGMRLFYASDLYRSLECEETKLWHLGAVALYDMWKINRIWQQQ